MANFRRKVQTIHLVGVMEFNVGFPSFNRWDAYGPTSVSLTDRRKARWRGGEVVDKGDLGVIVPLL